MTYRPLMIIYKKKNLKNTHKIIVFTDYSYILLCNKSQNAIYFLKN